MLIFEGPDRVGKSTAALLARQLLPGWAYRHHTKPPVNPFSYYGWFVADARPSVVVDRLHWSEQAYANAYRQGPELTAHQWRLLELMLLAHHATVVLMLDQPEAILSRWGQAEMYGPERVERLVSEFASLSVGSSRPHLSRLPRHIHSLPELVQDGQPTPAFQAILTQERALAQRAGLFPNPSVGYGFPGPDGLLVIGEAQSDQQYANDLGPRVAWDRGPASSHLWDSVDLCRLRWWQAFWTNASDWTASGLKTFASVILRPRRVLCLGRRAEALVSEACLADHAEVKALPHPQWHRRFRFRESIEYANMLSEAAGPEFLEQICQSDRLSIST